MKGFIDHPVKKVIREQWCKPLIKHLFEKLNYKLTYLGLPGIAAIDILTWIEYLDKVIAFDVGDYDVPYDDNKARKEILKLNNKLSELETKGLLANYSLYHGYIEEVVLKGMDRNRTSFNQNGLITIYNLDFCNSLTAPIAIADPISGEVNKYYKAEVIKKLLEIQREISRNNNSSKFVFYLTVHSKFWVEEAEKLFSGANYKLYKNYLSTLERLDEKERNIRLLRLYFIDFISTHFCSNEFIPEFLPTLDYIGLGNNRLLCFTVIGTYFKSPSCTAPFYQDIEILANEKFLKPDSKQINISIQADVKETNCKNNSVKAIQELRSYKERWIK